MDDDLPKEGELLDISKKAVVAKKQDSSVMAEKPTRKIPIGIIVMGTLLVAVFFVVKGDFGAHESKETLATYKEGTKTTFETMKDQLPYLVSVTCEGSNPAKVDCVNFVGVFIPSKENPNYLISMGVNDKVEGATNADILLIKDSVKILVDIKRTVLMSRKPLTFLVDSVTIPRVGDEFRVKTRCTEDSKEIVVCEKE